MKTASQQVSTMLTLLTGASLLTALPSTTLAADGYHKVKYPPMLCPNKTDDYSFSTKDTCASSIAYASCPAGKNIQQLTGLDKCKSSITDANPIEATCPNDTVKHQDADGSSDVCLKEVAKKVLTCVTGSLYKKAGAKDTPPKTGGIAGTHRKATDNADNYACLSDADFKPTCTSPLKLDAVSKKCKDTKDIKYSCSTPATLKDKKCITNNEPKCETGFTFDAKSGKCEKSTEPTKNCDADYPLVTLGGGTSETCQKSEPPQMECQPGTVLGGKCYGVPVKPSYK